MKKSVLKIIAASLFAAFLAIPSMAGAAKEPAPVPTGTAAPRDWNVYAPDGALSSGKIKGESAILIDAQTGKVLFEKNADDKRYPASTTKIMTCLLALESGKPLNEQVTIGDLPAADFASDSDNIGLRKGEVLTFEDLLGAMMVKSGNDAADAIAIHVSGSIDAFLERMNQKAQELGMTGTHYVCTNGLTNSKDHYTTPRDMSKLAMAAVRYPEFVRLVSLSSYKIAPTNKTDQERSFSSTNKLLGRTMYGYAYATGIKTGYTSMAQNALISSAQKDGMSLIAADMYVDIRNDMWVDSVTMFEYGFNFYDTVNLKDLVAGKIVSATVKDVAEDDPGQGSLELTLKPQGDAFITDKKDAVQSLKNDPSQLQATTVITKDTAPIQQGETVGTVAYSYQGATVLTCDLIASRDVAAYVPPTASPVLWVIPVVLAVLLIGVLAWWLIQRRSRRRRYHYRSSRR